jgi:hypothetical protein
MLSVLLPQVCQLPTILAHPWFERLVSGSSERLVSKASFVEWWSSRQLVAAPATRRLWEVLRPDGKHHLTYADFRPLLQVGAVVGCLCCWGVAAAQCVVCAWGLMA